MGHSKDGDKSAENGGTKNTSSAKFNAASETPATPAAESPMESNILRFPKGAVEDDHELGDDLLDDNNEPLMERGEEYFYEESGLPAERAIWHAYLIGHQAYMLNTGLPDDLRQSHYKMNCLLPAKILAKHGDGFFEESGEGVPTAVYVAALTWQAVRDNPQIVLNERIFNNQALDIIYDMIDYHHRRSSFEKLQQDTQGLVLATQVVLTMQHASHMENWKFRLFQKTLMPEDIEHSRALYQNLITEKWPSTDSPLEELLEKQLERLRSNLSDDNAMRVPSSKKRQVFKLIQGGKPKP